MKKQTIAPVQRTEADQVKRLSKQVGSRAFVFFLLLKFIKPF